MEEDQDFFIPLLYERRKAQQSQVFTADATWGLLGPQPYAFLAVCVAAMDVTEGHPVCMCVHVSDVLHVHLSGAH